ncbi:PREDICTED: uncharacterized protein LOC109175711 [Ipomoea nil]|uniref:uncharacterized protein LOC109175711 n=1 Tax=Ipomoea nil TaxID=35883 RepID=UPI00090161DC|nr:PREDICTED: uncharacterized protein LOC109175711 [Ipomoea nil]
MAFLSFLGRLLFVSVFILSAYQEFNEFGVDGGAAANALKPKFNVFSNHVSNHTGIQVPHIEMKHLVLGTIIIRGLGSFLFVFGCSLGAYILILHQAIVTPILYDFYNYDADKMEFAQLFVKFTQGLQLIGALLFFVGMKNSMPRRQTKKAAKTKTN